MNVVAAQSIRDVALLIAPYPVRCKEYTQTPILLRLYSQGHDGMFIATQSTVHRYSTQWIDLKSLVS